MKVSYDFMLLAIKELENKQNQARREKNKHGYKIDPILVYLSFAKPHVGASRIQTFLEGRVTIVKDVMQIIKNHAEKYLSRRHRSAHI